MLWSCHPRISLDSLFFFFFFPYVELYFPYQLFSSKILKVLTVSVSTITFLSAFLLFLSGMDLAHMLCHTLSQFF